MSGYFFEKERMISIIIPTLREESVLEKTLKNLKLLTRFPYEIIISDGRSTDRTLEIARKYTDKVVVYEGTVRQTIAHARNFGAEVAIGDLFVFMDADVIIPDPNDFFEKAVNAFEKEKNLVAITALVKVLPEYETFADRFWFGFLNLTNSINNNIFHKGTAPGEFQMMRADAFRAEGGYNQTLVASEDYEMFGRLSLIGKTRMLRHLTILHTGRRAHAIGWPRLLSQWFANWISVLVLKKAASKEWKVIR